MFSEEFQPPHIQQNGYAPNQPEFENEEYETEYESDNQFQPETIINPDLSMNGPPTLRSVTPANSNYGFGQSRPHYDPHFEYNYDTKTMSEEEKAKLKLHQGSVCQFTGKNPNPNYKNELAEYSHIDEATKYMLPKKTVQQFTEKNPNPNYKNELAEYSHVDEATKYMIQKPTVAQFQKKVPDYNRMKELPQKSRIPEEQIYNKKQKHNLLQLNQGSVVQHPRNGEYKTVEKYMAYRPKPDPLREEMPLVKLANPNHLLPSQVKKMQTYLTHPPTKTIKSIGFTSSAPSSPTLGRKNIWPPTNPQIGQLPRTGFNPNVMYNEDSRKHVWPPVGSNRFGSLNDINSQPIPTIGTGPASGVWNPDPEGHKSSHYYARYNPQQKLHAVWPPNRTSSMINLSSNPNSVRRPGESNDEYVRHTINSSIPLTYRCPPNTQFYNVPYYLNDENNNQLTEKFYQVQQPPTQQPQRNPNLVQIAKQQEFSNQSGEENFYDSEQHMDDQAELQYQQQQQRLQQQIQQQQQQQQQIQQQQIQQQQQQIQQQQQQIQQQQQQQQIQQQQPQQFNQPQQQLQPQQLQPQQFSGSSRSGTPSPVHFDAQQNVQFNQQQQDLYSKQQLQQQQLREFERQQAEKMQNRQQLQNRSHHLPKQPMPNNLNNNLIEEELIQQQYISQPTQSQPPRAKSPVYRPVSPRNIYQKPPSQPSGNQQQQTESVSNQQIIVQQIPGGGQQTIQYIQQPTVVKQVHQEQTYREQKVEMQKQYYIQN